MSETAFNSISDRPGIHLLADFEYTTFVDIVNTIRNNPKDYPEIWEQRVQSSLLELQSRDEILCNEWHTSETAKSAFKPNEQCQVSLSIVMA